MNRATGTTSLGFVILVITLYGIVILNGTTASISGTARARVLSKIETVDSVSQLSQKLNEGFEEIRQSVILEFSHFNAVAETNETTIISRFEASWSSMMNTLEKIQRIVDDLRRLVETLHQMTQTFIAVVNELSLWMDQVTIDSSILSSV